MKRKNMVIAILVCVSVFFMTGVAFAGDWQTSGDDIYYDSGNVGIGTTSPDVNLHIHGSTGAPNVYVTTDLTAQIPAVWLANDYSGTIHYAGMGLGTDNSLKFSTTGSFSNAGIVLSSGGNVGIGKTNPIKKLDIAGNPSSVNLRVQGSYETINTATGEAGDCI